MKQLGIREIRKALVGKTYHFASLEEDESRDFVEFRHLTISSSQKIVRVDKIEPDSYGVYQDEKFTYLLTFEDDDFAELPYDFIEELIQKGYVYQEFEGILNMPNSYSLIWAEEESSISVSVHTIFNYYVRNVMLGNLTTYEFAVKVAKKLGVSISYIYHFIDKDNDFDCAVRHFDWDNQEDYQERLEEFRLD